MNKIIISVLVVLLVVLGIFGINKSSQVTEYEAQNQKLIDKNKKLNKENEELYQTVVSKENNTEDKVKKDTENFLKAFFEYNTAKGERAWTKIKPFTTEKGAKMLTPSGTDINESAEKTAPDKTIISGIDKQLLYFTPVDEKNANIFARVWQKITVNNVTSVSQMLLDIKLVYNDEQKRWVVDDLKIQQPLEKEGHIS
ncbi:hypothetical protein QMA02_30095 [Bacillus wiedmannii]|uniref:hypothetical protein n=1 Tax=Bacillus TaxID=1386 RepID=UPI000BF091F4|nr:MULTISPECIES: hypothetical protein [Bacillus cereus group]MDI6680013.1 hypothetical protein [Bacillus wiedmannii]MED1383697.1 hypothetical protein [Bacillus mycoides]PEO39981.1 hypothetical protein CN555_06135 [Bacillus wiedmannii]